MTSIGCRPVPLLFVLLLSCLTSNADTPWEGTASDWKGFQRFDFQIEGNDCRVVLPVTPSEGKPWVWRARFPDFHTEVDVLLLQQGFHVAHIDTGGMFGSPRALRHWDAFYEALTERHGLSKCVALEAVSRGGLSAYRWAAQNPERVTCIYADTPVCDFKSWPLGQGAGVGDKKSWQTLLKQYGMTEEEALAYRENPLDVLGPIAAARIPLLHLVSLNDRVVPPKENTFLLAERYRELGGVIKIIEVAEGTVRSRGHHFTPPDPQRVADFVVKHSGS